jgi:hypothetical protein
MQRPALKMQIVMRQVCCCPHEAASGLTLSAAPQLHYPIFLDCIPKLVHAPALS